MAAKTAVVASAIMNRRSATLRSVRPLLTIKAIRDVAIRSRARTIRRHRGPIQHRKAAVAATRHRKAAAALAAVPVTVEDPLQVTVPVAVALRIAAVARMVATNS